MDEMRKANNVSAGGKRKINSGKEINEIEEENEEDDEVEDEVHEEHAENNHQRKKV